ncbi:hypothetical protein [Lysinibacillus sphaericus]|uniref:hypothetical protein n=1 Tax=Lysinibacillus TaxID=400634 RepID=UPI0005A2B878|nr:hypothetical protein [Lysinibacillus sphaericus]MBE5085674.1 hypothetical protein [Bacillus thuringiensis]AMO35288.1 hypothetical protein AR327_22620 [Lysinibacillus sphaericus]AMO35458.1 hypothetical protein AR327_23490 [Lysinibacillus sphaericus]AMR93109.1 hypothetical protein A1T07_23165 [Lysinibacillus sphaericus]MBG9710707.1 hypothetical protein [Lysinibacillus sphaericus]
MTEQHDFYSVVLNLFLLIFVSGVLVYISFMKYDLPIFIYILCGFEILLNIFNICRCTYRLIRFDY